jgi:hypothetical protein
VRLHAIDELSEVVVQHRPAAEKIDAPGAEAAEFVDGPEVRREVRPRIFARGAVAVDTGRVAAVEQRVLDEERARPPRHLRGEDASADPQLVTRLHSHSSGVG